jgi:hypothetical protein
MGELHTTCYFDTFITVAPDSAAQSGVEPPVTESPSVAARTYALIAAEPYEHTSDDVIFTVWADRRGIPQHERDAARTEFFSKGQPCLRSSDLGKRYGWGVHSDERGRVALYPLGSPEYAAFASAVSPLDGSPVAVKAAMRSSRR